MRNVIDARCPLAQIEVADMRCGRVHEECKTCGWNPLVNKRRKEKIQQLSAEGKLYEWGRSYAG